MKLTPRTMYAAWSWVALLTMMTICSTPLIAQAPTATLVGQVTDTSKAAIPGATVEVRNTATNQARTATTGAQGEYTVTTLDAGVYKVSISKSGFKQAQEEKLELQVDQTARLDVSLAVGDVSTTVSVSADVGLLNTETFTKGDVITPVEIAQIPLNGRDFNDLAFTVAGVQPAEAGAKGAAYVANGSRADSSGVYINGINDENPRDAGSQISPPLDAIQEFKIETSDYTAQYGRLSGSVVNLTLKSGGNRIHGSAFDYIRNDLFDAPQYNFNFPNPIVKSKLRQNQFGGNLSGPVWIPHVYNGHDSTFFQFSLELLRTIKGSSASSIVPTALERTGDFSQSNTGLTPYYFHNPAVNTKVLCAPPAPPAVPTPAQVAGCLYPAPYYKIPTIDPVAQKLLAYYPLPNLVAAQGSNNYLFNYNSLSNNSNSLIKLDQKVGSKDELSGFFLRRFSRSTNPTSGSALGTFGSNTTAHRR